MEILGFFFAVPSQFTGITRNSSPVLGCTRCPFQRGIACKSNNHPCYAIIQLLMKALNKPAPGEALCGCPLNPSVCFDSEQLTTTPLVPYKQVSHPSYNNCM